MIVGITAIGTGLAPVKQFAQATTVAEGLSAFVNAVSPPLDPADWLAFDSGWSSWVNPGPGMVWTFDRDTSTLVPAATPPFYVFAGSSKMVAVGGVTSQGWEVLDGLVTNLGAFTLDTTKAVGKITGQIQVNGTGLELRLTKGEGSIPISANYQHADTAGGWETFGFTTNAPGDLGDQTYRLEARLNGATSADLRFTSLSIAVNQN
jgi:hypothetical protein